MADEAQDQEALRSAKHDSTAPPTLVEQNQSFEDLWSYVTTSEQDMKEWPLAPPFANHLEEHQRTSRPARSDPGNLKEASVRKTYDVRRAESLQGFNDLNFLKDALSESDSRYGAVHVFDGRETHLITGVDLSRIMKSCEWIIKDHCEGLDEDSRLLDMTNYPQTSVVAWLRWLYIDDYTFCEAMLDGDVPLMLHLEVLHLAQKLRVPKLGDQAQMHMDRVITECISNKSPVLELCECVRYIYTELRDCDGLRNLIAIYCISNLEAHFANEEEAFRQTAFQSPLFHRDLIRANIESDFQCRWADKIIQMSVCDARVHSNAAVDGVTSDFTCEFHVPLEMHHTAQRARTSSDDAAPQELVEATSPEAPALVGHVMDRAQGSEQSEQPLVLPDAPSELPFRGRPPPPMLSTYDAVGPTSTNTYHHNPRRVYPTQFSTSFTQPPPRYVNPTIGETFCDAVTEQPLAQPARTFPLRPGEPTETDIRHLLQNPPARLTHNIDSVGGPRYPLRDWITNQMRHGQSRPRPTQPKPASTAAACPAYSSAHRRQTEQIHKFKLLDEMRHNTKRAVSEDEEGGEKKYKIRVTRTPKNAGNKFAEQEAAAKSALARLLKGESDYSANAVEASEEELKHKGCGSSCHDDHDMPTHSQLEPEAQATVASSSQADPSRRINTKALRNPSVLGAQAADIATNHGELLTTPAMARPEKNMDQENDNARKHDSKRRAAEQAKTSLLQRQVVKRPRNHPNPVYKALQAVHGPDWVNIEADARQSGPEKHVENYVPIDMDEDTRKAMGLQQTKSKQAIQLEEAGSSIVAKHPEAPSASSPTMEGYEVVVLSDEEDWEMLSG